MTLLEYKVKCPDCGSEIRLVSKEANPIIFTCAGCNRSIVMQGNTLYTVSKSYLSKILSQHRYKACGQITQAKVSSQIKHKTDDERLRNLQDLLKQDMDVAEFLKKV